MQQISATALKRRLENQESMILVDVREPEEYEEYNIGGRLIPLDRIMAMEVEELEDFKNEELIMICRSGKRSAQACLFLETLGFDHCTNLEGGLLAWRAVPGQ